MEMIFAAGCGHVTSATCLTPSGTMSAAKLPLPTTKRRSSRTRRSDERKRNLPGALTLQLRCLIRPPEARAKRASKDDGPGRASFEARLRRAPQDDGEKYAPGATSSSLRRLVLAAHALGRE